MASRQAARKSFQLLSGLLLIIILFLPLKTNGTFKKDTLNSQVAAVLQSLLLVFGGKVHGKSSNWRSRTPDDFLPSPVSVLQQLQHLAPLAALLTGADRGAEGDLGRARSNKSLGLAFSKTPGFPAAFLQHVQQLAPCYSQLAPSLLKTPFACCRKPQESK